MTSPPVARLHSPNNRWVLQIPRVYQLINPTGKIKSFHDLLEKIFRPLFEVTIKPKSDPNLHELLKQVRHLDMHLELT
jgi:AMP deaminase